jgi:hypothetical protein
VTVLYFGGLAGGAACFPAIHELSRRCREMLVVDPIWEFINQIGHAMDRVWILDLHFDKIGLDPLAEALSVSPVEEVRLLTARQPDRKESADKLCAARHAAGFDPGYESIVWCDRLETRAYPFPHDRFAIVDNALWHFGHTVGGAGRCMTAASGAWDAEKTRAIAFFVEAWDRVATDDLKFARPRR